MQRKMDRRGVCWGLDRHVGKKMERGERSVLGTGQTCRGMESTGDWTDMQKKKMERGVECTGDWTDMQRKLERRGERDRSWGLQRHAEKMVRRRERERSWGLDRHAEKNEEKERERIWGLDLRHAEKNGERRERENLGMRER